jgi:hypothetical protein
VWSDHAAVRYRSQQLRESTRTSTPNARTSYRGRSCNALPDRPARGNAGPRQPQAAHGHADALLGTTEICVLLFNDLNGTRCARSMSDDPRHQRHGRAAN